MSVPPSALTRSTITPSRHGESAIVGTVNAVLIGEFYAFAVEA